jgi:hypothetical protein
MNRKKNVSQSDLLHPAIQDQGGIAIERASCQMNARQMLLVAPRGPMKALKRVPAGSESFRSSG